MNDHELEQMEYRRIYGGHDTSTPPDSPAAPVARAFDAAVDALARAAFDHGAEGGASMSSERRRLDAAENERAARAALIAAHAAAVDAALQSGWHAGLDEGNVRAKAADAAGYARALAEVAQAAAPFTFCHDPKPPNGTARCCDYYHDERDGDCNGCKLWRALGGDATEDDAPADPPALVNGGPPTDALDDGR